MRLAPKLGIQAVLAAALLGLGIPQTMSAFDRLLPDAILAWLESGASTDPAKLKDARMDLQAAEQWWDSADNLSQIGRLHAELARRTGRADEARDEGRAAAQSFEQALARSPADSRDWAGLALARSRLEDLAGAAKALEMTLLTDPRRPEWVTWRCELGFLLYPHLSDLGHDVFMQQLRYAWRHQPQKLLAVVRLAGFTSPSGSTLVQSALADDPTAERQFEAALAAQPH